MPEFRYTLHPEPPRQGLVPAAPFSGMPADQGLQVEEQRRAWETGYRGHMERVVTVALEGLPHVEGSATPGYRFEGDRLVTDRELPANFDLWVRNLGVRVAAEGEPKPLTAYEAMERLPAEPEKARGRHA